MEEERKVKTNGNITVTTSNTFITARNLDKMTLKAKKLLYLAMSQCTRKDEEFYTYKIDVIEFADLMKVEPTNVYQEAKNICKELMSAYIEIENSNKRNFEMYSLFAKCSYADGQIVFKLNQDMTSVLLNLTGSFSKPLLNDFMKMRSSYSIEIWHLMQREMKSKKPGIGNVIEFDLTLDELRKVTGTSEKKTYDLIGNFKAKVLDKAIKDINECCGVRVEYRNKKHHYTIVGFHFTVKNLIEAPVITLELQKKMRKAELIGKKSREGLTPAEYDELQALVLELDQMTLEF